MNRHFESHHLIWLCRLVGVVKALKSRQCSRAPQISSSFNSGSSFLIVGKFKKKLLFLAQTISITLLHFKSIFLESSVELLFHSQNISV